MVLTFISLLEVNDLRAVTERETHTIFYFHNFPSSLNPISFTLIMDSINPKVADFHFRLNRFEFVHLSHWSALLTFVNVPISC